MKKIIKSVFVCILSTILFFCSLTNTCITVYAVNENESGGGGGHDFGNENSLAWAQKLHDFMSSVTSFSAFLSCEIFALGNGDYIQFMENYSARMAESMFNEDGTINTDNVTYDETTDTITMDVSSLLNALGNQIGLVVVPAETKYHGYLDNALPTYRHRKDYFITRVGWHCFDVYCIDLDSYYLIRNASGNLVSYDKVTLEEVEAFTDYYHSDGGIVVTNIYNCSRFAPITTYGYDHISYAYWSSMDMLKRFLNGSTYLGSSFGQNGTITIPVSDLEKDWENAYNTIVKELDDIKESTNERPTQEQIDDAIKKVLGELEDIGGDIGDIGGDIGDIGDDVEEIAKTLDDLYKLLGECKESLESLNSSLADGIYNQEQIIASLGYLKLINDSLSQLRDDQSQSNAVLLNELEQIRKLLSDSLSPDSGENITELVSSIETALQDISIFMKDRLLSVLESLSDSSAGMNSALGDANITLEQIRDILSRMEESDIDTAKLEEALEKIRDAIAESGNTNDENLTDMKDLLSGIQDALIEIKSGMAVKDNYTDVLSDIYALMEDMYKVQKLGTALDIADLLTDFTNLLDNGDTSFLDRMGTSFTNVANASKEHFPTSIPWDMVAVFTVFNAEPEIPSFDLPFSIPTAGVDETVTIDLSGFTQLSKISRIFLSVLFVLLLIHLTRKSTAPDEDGG